MGYPSWADISYSYLATTPVCGLPVPRKGFVRGTRLCLLKKKIKDSAQSSYSHMKEKGAKPLPLNRKRKQLCLSRAPWEEGGGVETTDKLLASRSWTACFSLIPGVLVVLDQNSDPFGLCQKKQSERQKGKEKEAHPGLAHPSPVMETISKHPELF